MKNKYVRLCGMATLLLALQTASAEARIVLDLPLERQVVQRNAEEWAEVKVAGTVPPEATLVEAKAELGVGLRGKGLREHGARWAEKVAPWLEKQTGKERDGK